MKSYLLKIEPVLWSFCVRQARKEDRSVASYIRSLIRSAAEEEDRPVAAASDPVSVPDPEVNDVSEFPFKSGQLVYDLQVGVYATVGYINMKEGTFGLLYEDDVCWDIFRFSYLTNITSIDDQCFDYAFSVGDIVIDLKDNSQGKVIRINEKEKWLAVGFESPKGNVVFKEPFKKKIRHFYTRVNNGPIHGV